MLKSFQRLRGAATLFHLPSSKASNTLVSFIQDSVTPRSVRHFDIEVTEKVPTSEQLDVLKKYAAKQGSASSPDSQGSDPELSSSGLIRPILVDWEHGKIAVNDVPGAKKILEDLLKSKE